VADQLCGKVSGHFLLVDKHVVELDQHLRAGYGLAVRAVLLYQTEGDGLLNGVLLIGAVNRNVGVKKITPAYLPFYGIVERLTNRQ
jgi:hypothetical protein